LLVALYLLRSGSALVGLYVELYQLLPHQTKNNIEIPQLIAEANRSNWAIDPRDVKCLHKIGAGGFGVCKLLSSRLLHRLADAVRVVVAVDRRFGWASGRAIRLPSRRCTVLYRPNHCASFAEKHRFLRMSTINSTTHALRIAHVV
jgi:hypothetical protein